MNSTLGYLCEGVTLVVLILHDHALHKKLEFFKRKEILRKTILVNLLCKFVACTYISFILLLISLWESSK